MLIPCPWCGTGHTGIHLWRRCHGAPPADRRWPRTTHGIDYLYLRNNPAARTVELWHHTAGCRQWLKVARDTTMTHEVRAGLATGAHGPR